MQQDVISDFLKIFGHSNGNNFEVLQFFSPGRVNIIGEHIDYNGGLVLPCAINLGTHAAARKRGDNIVKLASANFPGNSVEFSLKQLDFDAIHGWGNYPKGVIAQLAGAGYTFGGFEMYVNGNLPSGAGLSSSASITSLVALVVSHLFNLGIKPSARAKYCQMAEALSGVNCGIMDPFIITLGKAGNAMLLDCGNLEHEHIPLELGEYKIIIANTNMKRGLAASAYNTRRQECQEALSDIQAVTGVQHLCALSPEEFEAVAHLVSSNINRQRARHAVCENYRVKMAASLLRSGNVVAIGDLLKASHDSLRDLYEVSGLYLDAMVEAAYAYGTVAGTGAVAGARMTGAGFGGCTVNIVHGGHVDAFVDYVGAAYKSKTGNEATFYNVAVWEGAREII